MKGFPPNHIHLKSPVRSVSNDGDGRVLLHLESGKTEVFDHVILATHGDEALSILGRGVTPLERSVLSAFQTSQNEVILHSDLNFMPRNRKAWSSWNYLTLSSPGKANIDKVSLTYNMNILQHIPEHPFGDVLVTMNPIQRPRPETIQGKYWYSHPLYTPDAIRAQKQLHKIQNKRGISFAGAWTKYGFHEDGFSSGLAVAQNHLGAKLPFEFKDSTFSRGKRPQLSILDHLLRLLIMLIQVFVVQVIESLLNTRAKKSRVALGTRDIKANGKKTE